MTEWLNENWQELLAVIAAVSVIAKFVVNLTPTPKDNEALAKVYKVVEWAAGIITKKAKE